MTKMNPPSLKVLADRLAETVPDWAGRSFQPYLQFWKKDEDIWILGYDGRKIKFTPQEVDMINVAAKVPKASVGIEAKAAETPPHACATNAAGTGVTHRVPGTSGYGATSIQPPAVVKAGKKSLTSGTFGTSGTSETLSS